MCSSKTLKLAQFVALILVHLVVLIRASTGVSKLSSTAAASTSRTKPRGLFLIGDSTSARLYISGLKFVFNCEKRDKSAILNTELVGNSTKLAYNVPALVCKHKDVSRIGFMMHWGVGEGAYLTSWVDHRSVNDTVSSKKNIINSILEFQRRSEPEDGAIFVFLSNFWDAARIFLNIKQHKDKTLQSQLDAFGRNYLYVISKLLQLMRPNDLLVLQICHHSFKAWGSIVPLLNLEVMRISQENRLPVFRSDIMLFGEGTLEDGVHQNSAKSLECAKEIERLISDRVWK